MVVAERSFRHPYQASRVRLAVFERQKESTVAGMPDDSGYLVTEEWKGSSKVVKTLGFFKDRQPAVDALERRAAQLDAQRYHPVDPAA
jgi:hypothetical protein